MSTRPPEQHGPTSAEVAAARLLVSKLGLRIENLIEVPTRPPAPTFHDYIPIVAAGVRPGSRRLYSTNWKRIDNRWGERRIDQLTPSEIRQFLIEMKADLVIRRSGRGGHSAAEHLISALRCLYRHAEDDGLITPADNPARKVDKPRRPPSTRRAVADTRLAEIVHAAATTRDDPALDSLILRLHIETACRRGGALALRPSDLDRDQCLILLREKGETTRSQLVSPTLMAQLVAHAKERGADATPDGPLLRYWSGQQVTRRRYDYIWTRLGKHLPWVAAQGTSTHWLRHTTLTCRTQLRLCGGTRLRRPQPQQQ